MFCPSRALASGRRARQGRRVRSRVLLVHSGGFTSRQWRRLGEDLASDHEVMMPDLIGYGAEPRWPVGKPFHFRQDIERLAALLDADGDPTPVHLVGHSYGGLLVMQLALTRAVGSIAVFEPVTFGVLAERDEDADARAAVATLARYAPDERGVDEAWLQSFVDWWQGAGAWSRLAAETQQAFRDVGWKLSEEVASLVDDRTTAAQYGAISAPTLLLGGGRSQPAERRVLERLAAALPDATLKMFDEMGHMGPITHGAIVNAAIAAHVRDNS
jgi:pimeloyl-ACP methyl ester carboxylesterase